MIVDTHAHLTDETLAPSIVDYLAKAAAVNVKAILCVGTTATTSAQCVAFSQQYPQIRAAVGIHPNYCGQAADGDWEAVCKMVSQPGVVALGETGLDRYWDDCPWEIQVDFFRRHIELSRQTGLPVVIHTRECAEETLELLRGESHTAPVRGVMHSFTGPQHVADGCLELGLYISFAGMLTFKNAEDLRQIARTIPMDRLLVETDSPYLTPQPHRGVRPNHPANVVHTLRCLAEIRGVPLDAMAEQTTANAFRLFGNWN